MADQIEVVGFYNPHNAVLNGEGNDLLLYIQAARLQVGNTGRVVDAHLFTLGSATLVGGNGNDTLRGGPEGDKLDGRGGNDTLDGNAGDDKYVFDVDELLGTDTFTTATTDTAGNDTLDFSSTTSIAINVDLSLLASQSVVSVGNRLSLVLGSEAAAENVIGGTLGDTLTGSSLDNRISGGPGVDVMRGNGGDDTFLFEDAVSSELSEQIWGDAGMDTMDFSRMSSDQQLRVDFRGTGTVLQPYALMTNRTVIRLGISGTTTIERAIGSRGDDTFFDGALSQTFAGGLGDDRYVISNTNEADAVLEFPNEGNDQVDFSAMASPVRIDLALSGPFFAMRNVSLPFVQILSPGHPDLVTRVVSLNPGPDFENVVGGTGRDDIYGTNGDDFLDGWMGSDRLTGRGGDDLYVFGQTSTTGTSSDTIVEASNEGSDWISFGETSDPVTSTRIVSINLSAGVATVGSFTLNMTAGQIENATGGNGNDFLNGSTSNNRLVGGLGNDILRGAFGSDTLVGGQGNDDYIFESLLAIPLNGGFVFSPEIEAIIEPDLVLDPRGLPSLASNGQWQGVDGGVDTIDFSSVPAAMIASLSIDLRSISGLILQHVDPRIVTGGSPIRQVFSGSYTHSGIIYGTWIEDIVGSPAADSLLGNERDNDIHGGLGNDTLRGFAGNDVLTGGGNNNVVYGGAGDDRYRFDWVNSSQDTLVEATDRVEAGILSSDGSDTLDFSNANGSVTFNLNSFTTGVPGPVTLRSGTTVILKDTSQTLLPSTVSNGIPFENILGAASFANTLTGNGRPNLIVGGSLADTLIGGDGNDILVGFNGIDSLQGQNEDDLIIGGSVDFSVPASPTVFNVPIELRSLIAIRREWIGPSLFAVRQQNIRDGVGSASLNAKLVEGSTVINDGQPDFISGGTGTNWIIEPGASLSAHQSSGTKHRTRPLISESKVKNDATAPDWSESEELFQMLAEDICFSQRKRMARLLWL